MSQVVWEWELIPESAHELRPTLLMKLPAKLRESMEKVLQRQAGYYSMQLVYYPLSEAQNAPRGVTIQ